MERTYQEIKDEAANLGIEFRVNLGAVKLQAKIDEYYATEETDAKVDIPEVEVEADEVEEVNDVIIKSKSEITPIVKKKLSDKEQAAADELMHRQTIARLKKQMLKTKIVRVNMVDKRENSDVTATFVQNGAIGRHIPLDIPIELEQCLIDQLRRTKIPMHVKGLDGNSSTKLAKKFLVEEIQ